MNRMSFAGTPGSILILGAIVLISVLALRVAPKMLDRNLLRPYWLLREHQYDTIITSGFIHGNFGHLLLNSLMFFFFAPALELTIGTPRFVALYFISLVLSSLGSIYRHRNNPDYAALGASGAINAVLFAFIVYYPTRILYLYGLVPIPAVVFAFGYAGYSWWASRYKRDNIGHDAHLGGAITGLIFVGVTDFAAWGRAVHQVFG